MNERIKQLRKYLKETQIEFSARMGMANSQLSRIERGEGGGFTTKNLARLIETMPNLNLTWLITGHGPIENHIGVEEERLEYQRVKDLEAAIADKNEIITFLKEKLAQTKGND